MLQSYEISTYVKINGASMNILDIKIDPKYFFCVYHKSRIFAFNEKLVSTHHAHPISYLPCFDKL